MSQNITIQDIYNLFKESEKERLKAKAEADLSMDELRSLVAERTRSMEKLERTLEAGNKRVNDLSDRWGRFVENLVRPGLEKLFQERGIDVQETHPRMQSRRQGAAMEIDIFVVDGDTAIVVEVKSYLTQDKVTELLEKLPKFKAAFPLYKDYKIHGAIAGIEVDAQAARYAYKQGLLSQTR